jgi:hypothetical protein
MPSCWRYCFCCEKGGEIIPKIIAADLAKRNFDSQPTTYISNCPECQTVSVQEMKEKPIIIALILWLSSTNNWTDTAFYFTQWI